MRRILLVAIGLILAASAGMVFLAVGGLIAPATRELAGAMGLHALLASFIALTDADGAGRAAALALGGFWALASAILLLPPLVTALVGEAFGIRSFVWYGLGAGVLALAIAFLGQVEAAGAAPSPEDAAHRAILTLIFLSGACSGLVYWAAAGRTAGGEPVIPAP